MFRPGVLSDVFPTQPLRSRFSAGPQYRRIMRLAGFPGPDDPTATPDAPGVRRPEPIRPVRLPAPLHAALSKEAAAAGVSLDRLVADRLSAGGSA